MSMMLCIIIVKVKKTKSASIKVKPPPPPAAFKVGDRVRIFKKKKTFEKGFTANWTEEVFIVSEVKLTKPIAYKIKDLKGEEIYHQELQKTRQEIYRIEKVLKKRSTQKGTKEVYVKWKGYNNDFNSWIPESGSHSHDNNSLLPCNIRGIIIGKSNCGKTTLLLNLLLHPK